MCLLIGGSKAEFRRQYSEWMASRENTDRTTKEGVTSAGLLLDFKRLACVSTDIIVKSFKVTGISNAMDGTEDDWINERALRHRWKGEGAIPMKTSSKEDVHS